MPLEIRDLAKSPPDAESMAFSKIRGIANLGDEEGLAFFNGLFRAAALAKNDGDWSRVETLLDEWEAKLVSRARPGALRFETGPWAPLRNPLAKARVALISTGGVYIRGLQQPFDTAGDVSFRVIPTSTPRDAFGIAHSHYDTSSALQDVNVVFPYERLKEMETRGVIGNLADSAYGFMGYIVGDLVPKLLTESAPEVARRLVAEGVDAVLIGTT